MSSIISKLKKAMPFLARVAVLVSIPLVFFGVADAANVTNLTALSGNLDTALRFGSKALTNTATVAGLGLFFLGIFNLYTSHTKQASGGKPMSHGLVMLACGALLIGLPYVFQLVGNSVVGSRAIGQTITTINGGS